MSLTDTRQPTGLAGTPATAVSSTWRSKLQLIVVLFKLRIVFLLLMAATGGAFMAAGGWPGVGNLLLLWLTGGMAAAGASALNQYWERESDGNMGRTRQRPLVTGEIAQPNWVPYVGIGLVLLPSLEPTVGRSRSACSCRSCSSAVGWPRTRSCSDGRRCRRGSG